MICLSLTQMFHHPALIAMSIAATRIHRNLADYAHGSTDMCHFLRFLCLLRSLSSMICRSFVNLQICDGKITKAKWKPSPTPVSEIKIAVDTRCERHSVAQSIFGEDGQLPVGDKPHRSSLDSDLEAAMENSVPK